MVIKIRQNFRVGVGPFKVSFLSLKINHTKVFDLSKDF